MVPLIRPRVSRSRIGSSLAALALAIAGSLAPSLFAAPGDLYVTDTSTGSVVRYDSDGNPTTFVTGLESPQGITIDDQKNIYVADAHDGSAGAGEIVIFNLSGTKTGTLRSGLNNPTGIDAEIADVIAAEPGSVPARVLQIPIDGKGPSELTSGVTDALGVASQAAEQMGLFRYVCWDTNVRRVDPDINSFVDIDIAVGARGVAIDMTNDAFVSTDAGTVVKIPFDTTDVIPFASGFTMPTGVDFRPARFNGDIDRVGFLYVADTATGEISQISNTGVKSTFVASAGTPNFIAFESGQATPTPTPTPIPVITSPLTAGGVVGEAFTYTITATNSPTSFDATPLPDGLAVDTTTGVISGTPTTEGNTNVTISATNTTGTGSATLALSISSMPTPTPSGKALNISTRVDVETGDNVAIGGFIITGGTTNKTVVIRAIGPSLANSGVSGTLADPVLELHMPDGTVVTNDSWKDNSDADQGTIVAAGLNLYNGTAISDDEAILVASLPPRDDTVTGSGQYTAVVSGSGGGTGVGLVEVYDLDDPSVVAELANISTRGLVGTGDNVLIGGVILGPVGSGIDSSVVVRAIGPSLADAVPPVTDALADPFVELHNADGTTIATNDNWMDSADEATIMALGLAPGNDLESALLATPPSGNYTAIVTGVDNSTGVGLVEVFHVPTQSAK